MNLSRFPWLVGRNGVVDSGDRVTAAGLFVGHFQEYNTVWNGDRGTTILYRNELPYDLPALGDWMNGVRAMGVGAVPWWAPRAVPGQRRSGHDGPELSRVGGLVGCGAGTWRPH
jgi:hypothetical protein